MRVEIGTVRAFANVRPDKAQAMKIAEEMLEVYSAWENARFGCGLKDGCLECADCHENPAVGGCCTIAIDLLDECADVIQATCNLIAALDVEDFKPYMEACASRNRARGRYEEER